MMHIAVVGPMNVPQLSSFLHAEDRSVAERQSTGNGTAPALIVAGLLNRGHSVTAITYRQGEPGLRLDGPALRVRRVDFSRPRLTRSATRWALEVAALQQAIKDSGADVVHTQWPYEAAVAGVRSRVPQVATIRDAPLTVLRFYRTPTRLVRASLAFEFRIRSTRRTILTTVSPHLRSAWARQMVDGRDIRVIPNIAPSDMDVHRAPSDEPSILEVSDAGARKNISTLLRAFRIVRQSWPGAQLRLAGAGLAASDTLARRARRAGLADDVVFLGRLDRDRLRAEYARCWIHAHVALEETFGNTLVEAMMAGVPVLAGRWSGSVPWVLDQGAAGRLIDVRDDHQIAASLIDMLDQRTRADDLAASARLSAMKRFSEPTVIAKYEQAYLEAIDGSRSTSLNRAHAVSP